MAQAFRVHVLRGSGSDVVRDNLSGYLRGLHNRLHNAIHAQTRAYTCRAWRLTRGSVSPRGLHWNDRDVPGETLLGSFGWSVDDQLVERIAREFDRGDAVRLFTFDSDADLCFEEILVPDTASATGPYR